MARKVADVLRAAKARIDTADKWCQGHMWMWRNSDNRMCSLGALYVENVGHKEATEPLAQITSGYITLCGFAELESATTSGVWMYNDNHSHKTVMAAWDRAIALAEQTGAECDQVQS